MPRITKKTSMRRIMIFALAGLVFCNVLLAALPANVRAAEQRCFPETGQCISGVFRTYWEQNGGLAVFGLPITFAQDEINRATGETYPTQWFERNRFELHTRSGAPVVLLGRLGDERLIQQGINWQSLPREAGAKPGCLWFEITGHNVCDQGAGIGFKTYWQTHGLDLREPGTSERESLALFGLPLTEQRMETNSSGETVLTQWFERARFEWHPTKPAPYNVLLGLLGNEVHATLGVGVPGPHPIGPPAIAPEYTALGDSLVTGIFASKGYVPTYRDYLRDDGGLSMQLTNLGKNGWRSGDLLNALRKDQTFRNAVARSQVVTWNIGGNDLRQTRSRYKAGTCGGADNQACLRTAVSTLKSNWDAIMSEILTLRSTTNTIIRTMDTYNPYVNADQVVDSWPDDGGLNDFQVFKPYIDDVNSYMCLTAQSKKIPCAKVYVAFNGADGSIDPHEKGYLAFDDLHPNDKGHAVIAEQLRSLGLAPLK